MVTKDANWDIRYIRKYDHISLILNPKRKERIIKLPNTVIPHLLSDIVFSDSVMLFLFYVKQFLSTLNVKTHAQPGSVSLQAALPQSRHLSGRVSSEGSCSCLGRKACQLVAAFTRAGHVSSLICRLGFKTTLENRLKGELEAARERRQKSGRFLTTAPNPRASGDKRAAGVLFTSWAVCKNRVKAGSRSKECNRGINELRLIFLLP